MNTTNHQTKKTIKSEPLSAQQKKASKTKAFKAALDKEFRAIGTHYRQAGTAPAPDVPIYKKLQAAARADFSSRPENSRAALKFYYQIKGGGKIFIKYRITRLSGIVIEPTISFSSVWAALLID